MIKTPNPLKPFIAWNSCGQVTGLPARFETLELAKSFSATDGSANRVTHDDGRQWAAWGSGDNEYMVTGFSQTSDTWDLPENSDQKCATCTATRKDASLVYTIVPRIVEGAHPGGRVVEGARHRYYCVEHLPTDLQTLKAHHVDHACMNYPKDRPRLRLLQTMKKRRMVFIQIEVPLEDLPAIEETLATIQWPAAWVFCDFYEGDFYEGDNVQE